MGREYTQRTLDMRALSGYYKKLNAIHEEISEKGVELSLRHMGGETDLVDLANEVQQLIAQKELIIAEGREVQSRLGDVRYMDFVSMRYD